jgi:hypothetical protein
LRPLHVAHELACSQPFFRMISLEESSNQERSNLYQTEISVRYIKALLINGVRHGVSRFTNCKIAALRHEPHGVAGQIADADVVPPDNDDFGFAGVRWPLRRGGLAWVGALSARHRNQPARRDKRRTREEHMPAIKCSRAYA